MPLRGVCVVDKNLERRKSVMITSSTCPGHNDSQLSQPHGGPGTSTEHTTMSATGAPFRKEGFIPLASRSDASRQPSAINPL